MVLSHVVPLDPYTSPAPNQIPEFVLTKARARHLVGTVKLQPRMGAIKVCIKVCRCKLSTPRGS